MTDAVDIIQAPKSEHDPVEYDSRVNALLAAGLVDPLAAIDAAMTVAKASTAFVRPFLADRPGRVVVEVPDSPAVAALRKGP